MSPPEPDGWLQSGEKPWAGPVDVGLGWWPGGLLPWSPATLRQWEGLGPLADLLAQQLCPWGSH